MTSQTSSPRLLPRRPAAVTRVLRALAAWCTTGCLALAIAVPTPARAADAALTVTLPAGKHKAIRMRNLPKDAVIAVAVRSDGKIGVGLLSQHDYRTYPRAREPVFVGTLERTLSFQVVIPAAGAYYLVLDNRQGAEVRKVKIGIRAQRGLATPDVPEEERDDAGPPQGT